MRPPTRFSLLLAFAALYLIWGSTYLFIRLAIDAMPPFLMAGSRYLTAGVILYAIARLGGAAAPPVATWRSATIVGALLLLGGNGGVTISEEYIDTGLAAVMVATVPIYIVLLSWITGSSRRPRWPVLVGLAGGFLGVGLLMAPSLGAGDGGRSRIGMLILLCSSFVWSAGSLYSRRAQSADSPFVAAGQQMISGGALLFVTGLLARERFSPHQLTALAIWSWIYLVLIGAVVGFSAYIFLLRYCDPAKVATYAYVNPIVAVLLGALFHGESLSGRAIAATAIILGSVALVITVQQLRPEAALATQLAEAD